METILLIGSTMGVSFVAGIRLYATVLLLGLAIRLHVLHLIPAWHSLEVLAHPAVLGVAALGCVAEFCADKIPWVDSAWDSIHTVLRPIGAALIASGMLGAFDPWARVCLILLAGGVALASHGSKAATRLVVNHSPEPFTNIGMSLLGDVFTPFGLWVAFDHPVLTIVSLAVFLCVMVWMARRVARLLRRSWSMTSGWLRPKRTSQGFT